MKVLVVGSGARDKGEPFKDACRELGAAFAHEGFEVILGSGDRNAADPYVLEGVASVRGSHRVWIIRPGTTDIRFDEQISAQGNKIEFIHKRVRGSWSSGRVPQILMADAVLLIGGAEQTSAAGNIAPALERPVLAIGSFDGAAGDLWSQLGPFYAELGDLSNRVENLRTQWQKGNADLAAKVIRELVNRRTFKTKPRLPLGIYLFLLLACLVAWVALFANPLKNKVYSFFGMLALAGFLGTILRNNLRLVFDPTATFSWNELFIELGAGLLLGFALALLYFVGAITIAGNTDDLLKSQENNGNFQRVATVMTLLGLGGGLMIEQAADKVRHWFTSKFQETGD